MCLLIHKPAGIKLQDSVFENGDKNNPDGMGMAYVNNGRIVVDKGYFSLKKFMEDYRKLEDREMVIHFRRASPGMVVNIQSCHPFKLSPKGTPSTDFALAHNGRFNIKPEGAMSDTETFASLVLFPILERDPEFAERPDGSFLLEQYMGAGNKAIVMRYNRDERKLYITILNKNQGHVREKCWFSNDSYLPPLPKFTGGYMGQGYFGAEADNYWDHKHKFSRWNNTTLQMEPYEVWSKREKAEQDLAKKLRDEQEKRRLEALAEKYKYSRTAAPDGKLAIVKLEHGVVKKGAIDLSHLEPAGQKVLKTAAADYFLEARRIGDLPKGSNWNIWEMIDFMRSDLRKKFNLDVGLTNADLDKYIIHLQATAPGSWFDDDPLDMPDDTSAEAAGKTAGKTETGAA